MIELNIGERLRQFRMEYVITMPEIARATGIDKETLYKWERGGRPSDITLYTRLNEYLNKIEANATQAGISKVAALRLLLTSNEKPIPWPELIVEPNSDPFLSQSEGLIEIMNESMEPTIKKGSRIAISRLKDGGELAWGECYYVINKRWQGLVRRLYEAENGNAVRLISDHVDQEKYSSINLEWRKSKRSVRSERNYSILDRI